MRIPVPSLYLMAFLFGVGIQFALPVSISSIFWLRTTQAISIILLAVGAILAAWALLIFQEAHTTTNRNETSLRLITWGPYRFSRNPVYIGFFLVIIGLSVIFTLVWSIICQLFVFIYLNWVVIPFEETRLLRTFGEVYEQYRKAVRRWI